ncbi:MAG: DUF4040 domain-containing protein [Leptolyngbya sp.]|nr:DUF4040 domain-containing protein [Leptolyngbya sp.]
MADSYVYAIVALLPLATLMLMIQTSPYQALVMRGILGAVAALVYAVLGGADVALTEALVGTMLAITLYAVAVRSSLVMRLGILEETQAAQATPLGQILDPLRSVLRRHHLRLELVPYPDADSLAQALADKAVHGIYQAPTEIPSEIPTDPMTDPPTDPPAPPLPALTLRVPRLYALFTQELPTALVTLQPGGPAQAVIPPAAPLSKPVP